MEKSKEDIHDVKIFAINIKIPACGRALAGGGGAEIASPAPKQHMPTLFPRTTTGRCTYIELLIQTEAIPHAHSFGQIISFFLCFLPVFKNYFNKIYLNIDGKIVFPIHPIHISCLFIIYIYWIYSKAQHIRQCRLFL